MGTCLTPEKLSEKTRIIDVGILEIGIGIGIGIAIGIAIERE